MEIAHYDSVLNRYCFQKLPTADIDIGIRGRVEAALDFVCAELKLFPSPKVVWIQPAPVEVAIKLFGNRAQAWHEETHESYARIRSEIRQGYTPEHLSEIWIRSDYSDYPGLEYVVAHEARHVYQKSKNIDVFRNECKAEGDAYPYAYDVLQRYLTTKGCLNPSLKAAIDEQKESARSVFYQWFPQGTFEALTTL